MVNSRFDIRTMRAIIMGTALIAINASAGDLVYTPVNPTFGGNPNNASGLQSNASAQNNYKAPAAPSTTSTKTTTGNAALDKFNAQIQSAVLNKLSSSAVNELFGAAGQLTPGRTVIAGNYVIAVSQDDAGNLVLTTSDRTIPGSSTQIVVGNVSNQ